MNQPNNTLLESLLALWNWPVSERALPYVDLDFCRNPAISPRSVLSILSRSFSYSNIEAELSFFIQEMIAIYRRNERPTPRQLFLTDCCFMLITMEGGYLTENTAGLCEVPTPLHISKAIVQGVVETFPSVGWYTQIGSLIRQYLAESEVLLALSVGLSASRSYDITLSLLEGIRLYYNKASKDDDYTSLTSALSRLRSVIKLLEQSSDSSIQQASRAAQRTLDRYERKEDG